MEAGSECPTDGPIVPQTESNMILVGARRSDDILLEVNWRLIIGVLAGFFLCVSLTVLALYYFQSRAWSRSQTTPKPAYRAEGEQLQLVGLH